MQILSSSGVRRTWSRVVGAVEHGRQHIAIVRNGRLVAALIPYDQVERLGQLEDQADLVDARAAVADDARMGQPRADWELLKEYAGLD